MLRIKDQSGKDTDIQSLAKDLVVTINKSAMDLLRLLEVVEQQVIARSQSEVTAPEKLAGGLKEYDATKPAA